MTYTIGQVEDLTGVKAHILRYWEDVIPGFLPQKDDSGRRLYTQRDLELIFRLKYLITQKKFTVEGAGQQIIEDAEFVQHNPVIIRAIRECRSELSNIYLKLKEYDK